MTPEDGLALKIQCNLSDTQYQLIRNDIFPSLKSIQSVKSSCYPQETEITETSALCNLQSLLDHTASRILQLDSQKLIGIEPGCSGTLYLKMRMDGAT